MFLFERKKMKAARIELNHRDIKKKMIETMNIYSVFLCTDNKLSMWHRKIFSLPARRREEHLNAKKGSAAEMLTELPVSDRADIL